MERKNHCNFHKILLFYESSFTHSFSKTTIACKNQKISVKKTEIIKTRTTTIKIVSVKYITVY